MVAISPSTQEAFNNFVSDPSLLALPFNLSSEGLEALPAIANPTDADSTFQKTLAQLNSTIDAKTPLYIIIRRNASLTLITYVPYLIPAEIKKDFVKNRHDLIHQLGDEHFSVSVICKEPGDILDERSWNERDGQGESWSDTHEHDDKREDCIREEGKPGSFKDLGYIKTKCRLCDRRMKNEIEPSALEALNELSKGGDCVQISVDMPTLTLTLNFRASNISPSDLPSKLSSPVPSHTFYRHPATNILYFIFFCPDSAPVKVRMTNIMAMPSLVNIIAKERGAKVDQKIEIHDVQDLVFEEKDDRIGKFRSMYQLNDYDTQGTESRWEGMPVS